MTLRICLAILLLDPFLVQQLPAQTAQMVSPSPGSTLASSSVTFNWNAGSATAYLLTVGSSLNRPDYTSGQITTLSATVGNIPTDGRTIYVTLGSKIGTTWSANYYTYTAAN